MVNFQMIYQLGTPFWKSKKNMRQGEEDQLLPQQENGSSL